MPLRRFNMPKPKALPQGQRSLTDWVLLAALGVSFAVLALTLLRVYWR